MTKTAIQGPDMSDFAFLFVIGLWWILIAKLSVPFGCEVNLRSLWNFSLVKIPQALYLQFFQGRLTIKRLSRQRFQPISAEVPTRSSKQIIKSILWLVIKKERLQVNGEHSTGRKGELKRNTCSERLTTDSKKVSFLLQQKAHLQQTELTLPWQPIIGQCS